MSDIRSWEHNLAFRLIGGAYPYAIRPILFLLPADLAHELMPILVYALDWIARIWDWLMLGPARRALNAWVEAELVKKSGD